MSRRAWLRDQKAAEAQVNSAVEEVTTPLV
jgi:hypothetical protein